MVLAIKILSVFAAMFVVAVVINKIEAERLASESDNTEL